MAEEVLKVLLVEHDPEFARYATEMLRELRDLPAEVAWAPDFTHGLELVLKESFDVAILDLCAPDGAGLANVYLVSGLRPNIPVILAGQSDSEVIATEAVHVGAKDYLVKSQLTPTWLEHSLRYAIERHQLDLALLQAEEKYHTLFDHLVEGIFQTTEEGSYLLANQALARIYGYDSPEDLIRSLPTVKRGLYVVEGRREEFVRLMQEHDTMTGFESQVYRKDGSIIWISENCRAIRDAQGKLLYYEGTVEDTTQRREAEEKVRDSEALYHSLVETLPQNILRKDLQGRFTFANTQFCKTLGRRLEEIVGKTDADFFPPELAAKYQRDDRRVLETGENYETVEEHQPPGRDKIYVQVVKTPIYGADGKLIGLQGIFWDITQQRNAEEKIRRANTLLSQSRRELRMKNAQMEEDLKMAREIQLTMLPQQFPAFPPNAASAESAFQFTHRYFPTGSVGGDFFSVSALSEREAAVFICDVAGHGVRSALVTAMVRALVEELKPIATSPGQFLTKLNSDLYAILKHTGSPMLTTAFYLVADCTTGTMCYSNAGHPKPLHVRRKANKVEPLQNRSGRSQPALGLFEDASYETSEVRLEETDLVMLFTDGLYEVHDKADELYTQALLLDSVRQRLQTPVAPLFDQVLDEVRKFSANKGFTDDVCMVGMDYTKRLGLQPDAGL